MNFAGGFPVGLLVDWQAPETLRIPDAYLKNWLLDTGSLTERVQSLCHQFSLTLLGQQTIAPHENEMSLLKSNAEQAFQVREVLLCGNKVPWVFARSVIPQQMVEAELANLGQQPLGKRLFNDARFVRSTFQVCKLCASSMGYSEAQTLWGRRSLFTLNNQTMIVAEVFLPDAPVYDSRYHDEI